MRTTTLVLLVIMVAASLFSFGFVNNIHSGAAQLVFGVSLVLFVLTTLAGFTPSVQVRPAKGTTIATRAVPATPLGLGKFALMYVTLGGLGLIWCGIWYWYLCNHPPESDGTWYWCYGGLLSSLGMLSIGLGIGRIFRAARLAELPPEDTTPAPVEAHRVTTPAPTNPPANQLSAPPPAHPSQVR